MIRVYRFLKTNVFFALLPLVIVFVLRLLTQVPTSIGVYAPEILFLTIMVSVAAIDDINEEIPRHQWLLFDAIRSSLLTLVFISIGIYFTYTYSGIRNPNDIEFRDNCTIIAIILSIVLCCISIAAEVLLATTKPKGATP
jgi:hypothetical protein